MRVAVGLSGGVDSSVVLALLKSQGCDVFGLTMKIWDNTYSIVENNKHACFGPGEEEDVKECELLCKSLDVPYYVLDLSKEYSAHVLKYFTGEYESGRTPNPCVQCNLIMKFGFLLDATRKSGLNFDYFATGHYARIEKIGSRFYLKKAKDLSKDQSYFIHRLSSEVLEHTMFPLGNMTKLKVRELARKFGLSVAEKPESQDFIAGGDYTILFDKDFGPGDIVNEDGKKLGTHIGIINYTIGQRKGINVNSPVPLFVKEIDPIKNRIVVTENAKLFSSIIEARDAEFFPIDISPIGGKIRQNHKEDIIHIQIDGTNLTGVFNNSQRGITPGQSLVLYQNECIIGYGVIR
jgi:tRNA-specific 2-thiouridylase